MVPLLIIPILTLMDSGGSARNEEFYETAWGRREAAESAGET
jgi:hypothetical protein